MYGTEIWHYRARWPIDPFTRAYRRAPRGHVLQPQAARTRRALGLEHRAGRSSIPAIAPAFRASRRADTRQALRAELGIDEPRVILNVKRLHELAGQRYLIDAFARIARADRTCGW